MGTIFIFSQIDNKTREADSSSSLHSGNLCDEPPYGRLPQMGVNCRHGSSAVRRSPGHDSNLVTARYQGASTVTVARVTADLAGADHTGTE